RQGSFKGDQGLIFRQMPQKTENQHAREVVSFARFTQCPRYARKDCLEGNAAFSVCLRVEHDLGMDYAVGPSALNVGGGERVEVVFRDKYLCTRVVQVEKRLQVGELVGRPQRFDIRVGQGDAVAPGKLEHQFRLEGA